MRNILNCFSTMSPSDKLLVFRKFSLHSHILTIKFEHISLTCLKSFMWFFFLRTNTINAFESNKYVKRMLNDSYVSWCFQFANRSQCWCIEFQITSESSVWCDNATAHSTAESRLSHYENDDIKSKWIRMNLAKHKE